MKVIILLGNLPMWEQWAVVGLMAIAGVMTLNLITQTIDQWRSNC